MSFIRLLITLTFFTGISACGQPETNEKPIPHTTETDYTLTDSTAGSFALGDILPDSSGTFTLHKEQRDGLEGPPPQTVYHVSKGGAELMTIMPQYVGEAQVFTDRIAEIIVTSDRYRTEQGIGPGSTIEEFTIAYPEAKVWYTYVSDRFVLETPQHEKMQFLLNPEDFTGNVDPKSEITPLTLNDFREGSAIQAVRIY